jgi:hypothetical protein
MKHRQPGLFDVEERTAKLTKMGDPLVALNQELTGKHFGRSSIEFMKRLGKVMPVQNPLMLC